MGELVQAHAHTQPELQAVIEKSTHRTYFSQPAALQLQFSVRYFRDTDEKHICEIQLVHHQLMLVRSNMGAAWLTTTGSIIHDSDSPISAAHDVQNCSLPLKVSDAAGPSLQRAWSRRIPRRAVPHPPSR